MVINVLLRALFIDHPQLTIDVGYQVVVAEGEYTRNHILFRVFIGGWGAKDLCVGCIWEDNLDYPPKYTQRTDLWLPIPQ